MAIKYKIDILKALKEAGYSSARLRKDKIMGEGTIQQLREAKLVSWANIDKICSMLQCQVGDILEYED